MEDIDMECEELDAAEARDEEMALFKHIHENLLGKMDNDQKPKQTYALGATVEWVYAKSLDTYVSIDIIWDDQEINDLVHSNTKVH